MQNLKLTTPELAQNNILNRATLENIDFKIILHNLRSGHNIGSVFRSADAFNASKIYLTGYSAVPPNKEIMKIALGATETIPWENMTDPISLILKLKENGESVFAVEQTIDSIPLQNFNFLPHKKITLLFGNEVEGVPQETIDLCDGSIAIPQFGSKHSLNVSVSAGIVFWQIMLFQLSIK